MKKIITVFLDFAAFALAVMMFLSLFKALRDPVPAPFQSGPAAEHSFGSEWWRP